MCKSKLLMDISLWISQLAHILFGQRWTLHSDEIVDSSERNNNLNGDIELSFARSFKTLWTVARQAPLSRGFFRQESWSGLPFPPLGDLPNPGINLPSPASPALQADSLLAEPSGNILRCAFALWCVLVSPALKHKSDDGLSCLWFMNVLASSGRCARSSQCLSLLQL